MPNLTISYEGIFFNFQVCLVNIDQNAVKILESNEFPQFNSKILQQIISRDSFFATENQILRGVQEWIKFNPTENATDITSRAFNFIFCTFFSNQ